MRLVRVPLRVSLVGGGSDLPSHYKVHGGSVVNFTINKYIYITAKPNLNLFPHKYRLVYSQVEECNYAKDIKHPIIREVVARYINHLSGLDLDIMSDVPAGTGLGSSSAFTVGLHMALSGFRYKPVLAKLACETELDKLREPIGKQDQYAAAFGGLNHLRFRTDKVTVNPICLDFEEEGDLWKSLHLIYVGGTRNASTLLAKQKKNPESLCRMSELADSAYNSLKRGQIEDLGPIIREGWELKKSLSPSISNEHIDTIIDKAIQHGATGGKLLGAGGTGFVLLFCPIRNREKMLAGLEHLDLNYIPFEMSYEGAKVLYED